MEKKKDSMGSDIDGALQHFSDYMGKDYLKNTVHACWKLLHSQTSGNSSSERETWLCIHCNKHKIISSNRGKRSNKSIYSACGCPNSI